MALVTIELEEYENLKKAWCESPNVTIREIFHGYPCITVVLKEEAFQKVKDMYNEASNKLREIERERNSRSGVSYSFLERLRFLFTNDVPVKEKRNE